MNISLSQLMIDDLNLCQMFLILVVFTSDLNNSYTKCSGFFSLSFSVTFLGGGGGVGSDC